MIFNNNNNNNNNNSNSNNSNNIIIIVIIVIVKIPLKEMNFTLNKREFRDAIKLRYGWEFNDIPTVCVCGELFDADHALIYAWKIYHTAAQRNSRSRG